MLRRRLCHRDRTVRANGDGSRHGNGAKAGLRPKRRERPESRLRHRISHHRDGVTPVHRGEGTGQRSQNSYHHQERNPLPASTSPNEFILAIVVIDQDATVIRYCRTPFEKEPDFKATSVNSRPEQIAGPSQGAGMSKQPKKPAVSPRAARRRLRASPARGG